MTSKDLYDQNYLLNGCGGGKEFITGKFEKRFHDAISLAKLQKNDKVLDIGGGRGEIALLSYKSGANITAIDNSKSSFLIMKKLLSSCKDKNRIKIINMDLSLISFKDNYFDKIFFLEVLEHLTPKEVDITMKKILKILKPGGKLILSTGPNKYLINILLNIAKIFKKINWESRKYHINEQSFFSLKKLLSVYFNNYQLIPVHNNSWFIGQIEENNEVNNNVKYFIGIFNKIFDSKLFYFLRKSRLLNKVSCTSFLVSATKS